MPKRRPGRFLLTGSQSFELMQGVSESLAGRCAILNLHTLSWSELRRARPGASVEDFLFAGGYPELHAEAEIDRELRYPSYVATYLERDVRNIVRVAALEVDAVIEEGGGKLTAIECKLSENPGSRDCSGIHALRAFYGPRNVPRAWIVCRTRRRYRIKEGIEAVDVEDLDALAE